MNEGADDSELKNNNKCLYIFYTCKERHRTQRTRRDTQFKGEWAKEEREVSLCRLHTNVIPEYLYTAYRIHRIITDLDVHESVYGLIS